MFTGSSADNVASEFIPSYNCAKWDYYDRDALETRQNHGIAFPCTEYEILMCHDLFLELDTQRWRGVMPGDNWKPSKWRAGAQSIFIPLCLQASLLIAAWSRISGCLLTPIRACVCACVCVGVCVCSHRRSVHHPIGSLLAFKHHTVCFPPLLRGPENKNTTGNTHPNLKLTTDIPTLTCTAP